MAKRSDPRSKTRRIPPAWVPLIARSAILAIVLGSVAIVATLLMNGGFDDLDTGPKRLEFTDQDLDPDATLLTKAFLKQSHADFRLAVYLWIQAKQRLPPDQLAQIKGDLARGQINPFMAELARNLSEDLAANRAAVFAFWVDPEEQSSVNLELDGVSLGSYPNSKERYAITFVGRYGTKRKLRIIAQPDDLNSVTVFRGATARTNAQTRRLRVGKNDVWELVLD